MFAERGIFHHLASHYPGILQEAPPVNISGAMSPSGAPKGGGAMRMDGSTLSSKDPKENAVICNQWVMAH